MHCTFYDKMTEGKDCVKIELTQNQYLDLIKFINDKFDRDEKGKPILIKTDAVYGKNDAFYDAKGSYSFLDTCNTCLLYTSMCIRDRGGLEKMQTSSPNKAVLSIFWQK